jgi:nucleotide-binding universal stress UspA family protein
MPDQHGAAEVEGQADVEEIGRVSIERGVARRIVRAQVRSPRPDIVEQDDAILVGERRGHEAPHVLITAEAMGEDHRRFALAKDLHVVAGENVVVHETKRGDREHTGARRRDADAVAIGGIAP